MQNPPAWHPDPTGAHDHRWWDGEQWTEHVADAGVAAIDPLPGAEAASGTDTASGTAAASGTDAASGTEPADAGGGETAMEATLTPAESVDGAPPTDDTMASPAMTDADATRQIEPSPAGDQDAASEPTTVMGRVPDGPDDQQPPPSSPQPPWGGDAAWQRPEVTARAATTASGLAITALVLGLLSIPTGLFLVGGLLGIAAIVCGAIAASRAKRGLAGGRGMAIGGLISGVVGVIIASILVVFAFRVGAEVTRCLEETGGDQQLCMQRLEEQLLDRFLSAP